MSTEVATSAFLPLSSTFRPAAPELKRVESAVIAAPIGLSRSVHVRTVPGVTIQKFTRAGATICVRAIVCALCLLLPVAASPTNDNDAGIWIHSQIEMPLDQRVAAHLMVQNR
jgi:hypothetical protein